MASDRSYVPESLFNLGTAWKRAKEDGDSRQAVNGSEDSSSTSAPAKRPDEEHLTLAKPAAPGPLSPRGRNDELSPRASRNFIAKPTTFSERVRSKVALWSFLLCVLAPTGLAAIYYGLIASNQYVAEFRFTVKDTAQRGALTGNNILSALTGGSSANNTDNYLVVDYLLSRQAIEELEARIGVTKLYAKAEADWWSRYNLSRPLERFVAYWNTVTTAKFDQVTGIATAQVKAYTPEDALLIARTMVTLSEELVNSIAGRAQNDAVRFAQREVMQAEQRLLTVRGKLTEYRNRTGVIDPTTSVAASNSALVQSLRATLAQLETQHSALIRQNLDPTSPTITVISNQIRSTRDQLQKVEASVAQDKDGKSLSTVVAEYEQLDLERQFAQNMVTSTMQALDQARANAAAQHLYITPYVQPHLPQSATQPRRFLATLSVAALSFLLWFIALLVLRSVRERFS
jgi:capsular polysaccharide transport system permease protein